VPNKETWKLRVKEIFKRKILNKYFTGKKSGHLKMKGKSKKKEGRNKHRKSK
jgi:hypothetical protein